MAIEYTWTIEQMYVRPTFEANTNVVASAAWKCVGADGEFSDTVFGNTSFSAPAGDFTVYDNLTQEQVVQWVWAAADVKAQTEAKIADSIERQVNPPLITPPLPWI